MKENVRLCSHVCREAKCWRVQINNGKNLEEKWAYISARGSNNQYLEKRLRQNRVQEIVPTIGFLYVPFHVTKNKTKGYLWVWPYHWKAEK